jgi:DNA polymerase I-like protein with 3'-5' exonuclease and polymerase domains
MVFRWARDVLQGKRLIGANLAYDLGWLRREGVVIDAAGYDDVQYAAPLLNEHLPSYSLASLAEQHEVTEHGKGGEDAALYEWLAASYGGAPTPRAQGGRIHLAPVALVGPYAEADVSLPFAIFEQQQEALAEEGLWDVYALEAALIPLLVEMRWRGVRADVAGAEQLVERLEAEALAIRAALGPGAAPGSPAWLAAAFAREGIDVPKTAKGNHSVTKDWLGEQQGVLAEQIKALRRIEKAVGTFIKGYVVDKAHGGRIHGEFHPLRTDENGTISGRLSSSNPNLQNIPSRDEQIKRWTRGLFLPDEGERLFSPDYSQLEYRLMVHCATGRGAEEARRRFQADPRTDYHAWTQEMVRERFGLTLNRKAIKNVNFGKIFGMGQRKLQAMIGLSASEADTFFRAYDGALPFAKTTLNAMGREAKEAGYIRTLSGRKARFPYWEPRDGKGEATGEEAARARWGAQIQRSRTHKALNAYTQGSGGDIIKKAMLEVWQQLDEVPLLTVHDELVFSIGGDAGEREERGRRIVGVMEEAARGWNLSIPLVVDPKWGDNWGEME